MIFGEIVFRLQAVNAVSLTQAHGRLVHAAFFNALHDMSEAMAKYIHDDVKTKPFTMSLVESECKHYDKGNNLLIAAGEMASVRITFFSQPLLELFANLQEGYKLRLGKGEFVVLDKEIHCFEETEFIDECLNMPYRNELTIEFLTPGMYRFFEDDFVFPAPDMVWGSLAYKWNQLGMELQLDNNDIKEKAKSIILKSWHGQSEKRYAGKNRELNCFTGSFTYSLKYVPPEYQRIMRMLAFFGIFSGTGRMTSQGFGRIFVK